MNRAKIGQIVYYKSYGTPKGEYASQYRAAIVTSIFSALNVVDICVINPEGLFFNKEVYYGQNGGQWCFVEDAE